MTVALLLYVIGRVIGNCDSILRLARYRESG